MKRLVALTLLAFALCGSASALTSGQKAALFGKACVPSTAINFDFTSGSLPGAITFTRASSGSYFNSSNVLQPFGAGSNVARFDYMALGATPTLLYEPAATNLWLQSNNFTTTWFVLNNGTLASGVFSSPDGTLDGWSLTNTAGGFPAIAEFLANAAVQYTLSIWVKSISGSIPGTVAINGTQVSLPTITSTLQRLSATLTPAAAGGGATSQGFGNGSATTGLIAGLFGAQWETGAVATSYIPTTTASVTRATDSATFNIASCVKHLTVKFDDNSTQSIAVSAGGYTLTTALNRPNIKTIVGAP